MKVVLLKDVKKLGKAGQVVEVANGYAQNYLLPNKLASVGNSAMNEAKNAQVAKDYHAEQDRLKAVEMANNLKDYVATIKVRVGEGGKLFGNVTNSEVAKTIYNDLGFDIDKKKISLDGVKVVGRYMATIKLHPTVTAKITVNVIADK